ncbi:MAG: hypothetical protein EHM72_01505 [Calditrichaeota bacterium]|nr:MAG: hypothetical protein EHM72_01505 [Calditrichota bacterium]
MKLTPLVVICFFATAVAHSPIRLLPANPHYFEFRGKPTALITSGEHYGAVLNLDFDGRRYLQTLAAAGLNLTRLFSGSYVEKQGAFGIEKNVLAPDENRFLPPWARSQSPGYAGSGNKFNLDAFNPEYFARLRNFVKTADQLDIVVEVVLFSSIYTEENWRFMPFHPQNNVNHIEIDDRLLVHTLDNGRLLSFQEKMVRKIVRELNEFDNVYFEIQNEPWSDHADSAGVLLDHLADDDLNKINVSWQNQLDLADAASLRWQQRIADIIVDEEKGLPKKHLIAQNYVNFLYPLAKVSSAVSILNFHYALPAAVSLNDYFHRPISFDESGFAGPGDDVYRRQAWRFLLAGGAVFNGLDYSFYPGCEDGSGVISGPGGGSPTLRSQLAALLRFINSFDLSRLHPDHTTLLHTPELFPHLLSIPGDEYAGYFQGRWPSRITWRLPQGSYELKWLNAKNGDVVQMQHLSSDGGISEVETPPFEEEIALDMRRK